MKLLALKYLLEFAGVFLGTLTEHAALDFISNRTKKKEEINAGKSA